MFTSQAPFIANTTPGNGQQVQSTLQAYANCAQPLTTRSSVNIDTASQVAPPQSGYFTTWPNEAEGSWGNTWNSQNPSSSNFTQTTDGNYWGGDIFNGPTFLSNNFNNTLGDWYNQTFIDQSYNDFGISLQTTQNDYRQNVNNFAGDSYFDNTTTYNNSTQNNMTILGDTINQGPVTNNNVVVNNSPVYNNNATYLNEQQTFLTNENNVTNLAQYIVNQVVNVLINGGGGQNVPPVNKSFSGEVTVEFPGPPMCDSETGDLTTGRPVKKNIAVTLWPANNGPGWINNP